MQWFSAMLPSFVNTAVDRRNKMENDWKTIGFISSFDYGNNVKCNKQSNAVKKNLLNSIFRFVGILLLRLYYIFVLLDQRNLSIKKWIFNKEMRWAMKSAWDEALNCKAFTRMQTKRKMHAKQTDIDWLLSSVRDSFEFDFMATKMERGKKRHGKIN